ncbi:NAD(P)/FAD-dependent oxidoreductase [bacterium]|nr:NAD(P)/FAD-dependent oxidoreductase [bacterium]
MNIGIIGAGLAGLTAARQLLKAGHNVTVIEKEKKTGGLAGTFSFQGTRLEIFYHHFFTTDQETVQLIKEVGLADEIIWQETPMGIFKNNRLFKFASPLDLIRFKPLSFFNRIRFGVVVLYLSRIKNWWKYENVCAKDWIIQAFGKQAWEVIWGPLLHGKFGEYASEIGMPWFYSRIHTRAGSREKGMTKESLGYLRGSFQVLHDRLVQDIKKLGGSVRCSEAVRQIVVKNGRARGWKTSAKTEIFDSVLATLAPQGLIKLLSKNSVGDYWDRLRQVTYIGNVCAVLTLKRSLSPIYWMNIPDRQSPFIAVIEHSNFIDKKNYQDRHVLYLSSYLPTEHPRYRADDKTLLKEYYDYLKKIIPSFTPADVVQSHVFHAPFAQPVIRAGFGKTLVPYASPITGLYLANMAQIYPEDRGMSYSIRLGREAAETIKEYIPEKKAVRSGITKATGLKKIKKAGQKRVIWKKTTKRK